jgi:hypothetical protein
MESCKLADPKRWLGKGHGPWLEWSGQTEKCDFCGLVRIRLDSRLYDMAGMWERWGRHGYEWSENNPPECVD